MRRDDHIRAGRIELGVEGLSVDLSDEELRKRLTSYPSLAGAKPAREVIVEGEASGYRTDLAQVVFAHASRLGLMGLFPWLDRSPVLVWETHGSDSDAYQARFEALGPVKIEGVDDVRLTFPSVGGVDAPEFIALWWVLLLALSSLVRYEPGHWARAIDPDSSKLAVPLEQVCDFAETFVPDILLHIISSAS